MRWLTGSLFALLLIAGCGDGGSEAGATSEVATTGTLAGTTTSVSVTTAPPPPTQTEPSPSEGFDGRIGVSVVEIITDRVVAPEFGLPAAEGGQTYFSARITVTRIESVHLVSLFGHETERPTVQDAGGQTYELASATVRGLRFTDPNSISSPSEVVEGAEGVLVFEIPEGSRITVLTLIYSHRADWDDASSEERGEMTLVLDASA